MKHICSQKTRQTNKSEGNTRVLLVGYLGGINVGDEAIGIAVATILAEQPHVELKLLSGQPSLSEQFTGLSCEVVKGLYPGPRMTFSQLWKFTALVKNSDLVLFVGGGLIQDVHSTSLLTHCALTALMGKVFNTFNAAIGIGAGPVSTKKGHKLTNTFLNNIDFISLRDKPSYDYLKRGVGAGAVNIHLGSDSIFLLKNMFVTKKVKRSFRVGLCFRHWSNLSYDTLKLLTGKLIDRGETPVFFAYERSDVGLFKRLDMDFPGKVELADSSTFDAVKSEIIGLDGLISMRLHACLFAIMNRLPFVAIAYDPKIDNVITDAGFSHQVLPLPLNPDLILSRLREFNFNDSSERIVDKAYMSGCEVLGNLTKVSLNHKKPVGNRLIAAQKSLVIVAGELIMPCIQKWAISCSGGVAQFIPKRLKNYLKKLIGIEW